MTRQPGDAVREPIAAQLAAQLLDAVGQAVIATDTAGTVIFWNAAAANLYGWTAGEALGRPIYELTVPADLPPDGSAIMATVLAGNSWSGQFSVRRRDGSTFPALVVDAPLRDGHGVVVGVVGVSTDLTETLATRGALDDSTEMFRRRFLDAPVAQAILAPDGSFEQVNPALAAQLGIPAQALVGRNAVEFIHPADRRPAERQWAELASGRRLAAAAARRYVTGDGERWGAVSMVAIQLRDGTRRIAVFVQDISAEREAREQAGEALAALARSEARFRALVDRSADAALILGPDAVVSYASPAIRAALGYDPGDLVGRSGFDFVHPDDLDYARGVFDAVLATPGAHPPLQMRIRAADGRYIWTEDAVTNSLDDPAVGGVILNLRDVTDRKAAADALAESEKRYRDIVETAEEGIWIIDGQHRTSFVNPRMTTLLARPASELTGRHPADFVHPEDLATVRTQLAGRRAGAGRFEARLLRSDGEPVWVLLSAHPLYGDDGEYTGAHAMLTDITDRRRFEDQLRHHALHDQLTGLANRTLLGDRMEQTLARIDRHGTLGAVMLIDLDHFKYVNDTHGHSAGDGLLIEMANRICSAVRTHDTVARFGGDEFVVLCEGLHDRKEALDIASRVLAAIREPIAIADGSSVVTATIGVAFTPAPDEGILLRNADAAMYRAKERGRGRVEVFDPAEQETLRRRMGLMNDLRAALQRRGEIAVHYQPIVELPAQRLAGAEALVRWRHPVHGYLSPAEFVPLAESAGLVLDLDRLVLDEACRQAAAWLSSGAVGADFSVAVNVSARHFAEQGLATAVRESLRRWELQSRHLTIEVTETAVMSEADRASVTLAELRAAGVCVALDDFGTGYSSLAYLKQIPADRLKIDRSFIGGLGENGDDEAITASIVSLASTVGLTCVAEGVETVDQLAALLRLGCPLAQGFLWSAAVPAEALPTALKAAATIPAPTESPAPAEMSATDATVLRKVRRLHADGASLQTIAAQLNGAGLRNHRGQRWHPATVAGIIADRHE